MIDICQILWSMFENKESGQNTIITRKEFNLSVQKKLSLLYKLIVVMMYENTEKGLSPQIVILKAGLFKGYATACG